MMTEIEKKRKEIEILRKSSQLQLARKYVKDIQHPESLDSSFITEIIRVMLLTNDVDGIKQWLKKMALLPEDQQITDEEVSLRIKINFPNIRIPAIQLKPSQYSWTRTYQEKGIDRIFTPEIRKCQIVTDGFTRYTFTNLCPSCNKLHFVQIRGTLLVNKMVICGHCLCKIMVKFTAIRDFIFAHHNEFIGRSVYNYHMDFMKLKNRINGGYKDASVPLMATQLGQDTTFLLNQIVSNMMLLKKTSET